LTHPSSPYYDYIKTQFFDALNVINQQPKETTTMSKTVSASATIKPTYQLALEVFGDVSITSSTRDKPGTVEVGRHIEVTIVSPDDAIRWIRIPVTGDNLKAIIDMYWDEIADALIGDASDQL